MKSTGLARIEQVRVSGGGARSALWRQILADVFDAELVTVNTTEGAAYGAALLAGIGAGLWADVETACDRTTRVTGSESPAPRQVDVYRKVYPLYRELYPALRKSFDKISSL